MNNDRTGRAAFRCAACGAQFADRSAGERHSARFAGTAPHLIVPSGTGAVNPDLTGTEIPTDRTTGG